MFKAMNYDVDRNVPSYVPCSIPFINERLKQEGCFSRLSLFIGLSLISLPCYSQSDSFDNPELPMWNSFDLGYKERNDYLGIDVLPQEFKTFEEGIAAISNSIEQHKIFMVSGTPYYLPYSKYYYHPKFTEMYGQDLGVRDHWIGILGVGDEEVLVYDTTPKNVIKKIPLNDFNLFWLGNKNIKGFESVEGIDEFLSYGYFNINVKDKFDIEKTKEFLQRSLNTIADEYLKGRIISKENSTLHFGYKSIEKFAKDLLLLKGNLTNHDMEKYADCIFGMKFSRYFLRDVLEDDLLLNNDFGDRHHFQINFSKIVNKWELIATKYSVKLKRLNHVNETIDDLVEDLNKIKAMEIEFYNSWINNHAKNYLEV